MVGNLLLRRKESQIKPDPEFGKRTKKKKRKRVAEVETDKRMEQLRKRRKVGKSKKRGGDDHVEDFEGAKEGAVEAIRTLLEVTSEERNKRGR